MIEEAIHVSEVLLRHLLLLKISWIPGLSCDQLSLPEKGQILTEDGTIKTFQWKVSGRYVFKLILANLTGGFLINKVVRKVVGYFFNTVVEQDEQLIVTIEAHRNERLTEAINRKRKLIQLHQTLNLDIINLISFIIHNQHSENPLILVGNRKNIPSVVLLNKVHLEILSGKFPLKYFFKSLQAEFLEGLLAVILLHNGYTVL